MGKLTQAEIKSKADEWALNQKKLEKAEKSKTAAVDELMSKFVEPLARISEVHDPKIKELQEKSATLDKEIKEALKLIDKPITLNSKYAVASLVQKFGNRVVDAKKFFEVAKDKFWDCITVGVDKAEKAIGKQEVDKISNKPPKFEPTLVLK